MIKAVLLSTCIACPAGAATLPPIYDASFYAPGKWSPMPVAIEAAPFEGDLWPIIGGAAIVAAILLLFDSDGDDGKAIVTPPDFPAQVPVPASFWLLLAALVVFKASRPVPGSAPETVFLNSPGAAASGNFSAAFRRIIHLRHDVGVGTAGRAPRAPDDPPERG